MISPAAFHKVIESVREHLRSQVPSMSEDEKQAAASLMIELLHRTDGTLSLEYLADYEVLVIEGSPYAVDLFRGFRAMAEGQTLRFVKRGEDGALFFQTVPEVKPGEVAPEQRAAILNEGHEAGYQKGFNEASAAAAGPCPECGYTVKP